MHGREPARSATPTWMSMIRLAMSPGTAVLPMWWMPPVIQAPMAARIARDSRSNRAGQSGRYGTSRIGSSTGSGSAAGVEASGVTRADCHVRYRRAVNPVDRADLRARVEKALGVFLAQQRALLVAIDPALGPVTEAIEAFVLGGGKRLRPAFAYWGFRGAGGIDSDAVVAAVASLELVQGSALIHDDVMDASDTRRGEPAVHRRFAALHATQGWDGDAEAFGAASAILPGDLCLTWSDELLRVSGLDSAALLRARAVFDVMRTEVIAGQYLDVHAQATGDSSLRRASTVARYKSAKYTVE